MRKELAKENGLRKKFRATFERIGKKAGFKGYSEETVLLKAIVDLETNKQVADHVWFNYTKGFENVKLLAGVILEFEARVTIYRKGYVNRGVRFNDRIDYKLSNPTKIRKVENGTP